MLRILLFLCTLPILIGAGFDDIGKGAYFDGTGLASGVVKMGGLEFILDLDGDTKMEASVDDVLNISTGSVLALTIDAAQDVTILAGDLTLSSTNNLRFNDGAERINSTGSFMDFYNNDAVVFRMASGDLRNNADSDLIMTGDGFIYDSGGSLDLGAVCTAVKTGVGAGDLCATNAFEIQGEIFLPGSESATPAEPQACAAATFGDTQVHRDTDAGSSEVCYCGHTGAAYDWLQMDNTTACSFF